MPEEEIHMWLRLITVAKDKADELEPSANFLRKKLRGLNTRKNDTRKRHSMFWSL